MPRVRMYCEIVSRFAASVPETVVLISLTPALTAATAQAFAIEKLSLHCMPKRISMRSRTPFCNSPIKSLNSSAVMMPASSDTVTRVAPASIAV